MYAGTHIMGISMPTQPCWGPRQANLQGAQHRPGRGLLHRLAVAVAGKAGPGPNDPGRPLARRIPVGLLRPKAPRAYLPPHTCLPGWRGEPLPSCLQPAWDHPCDPQSLLEVLVGTMRFGSTTKVLAKRTLKFPSISIAFGPCA